MNLIVIRRVCQNRPNKRLRSQFYPFLSNEISKIIEDLSPITNWTLRPEVDVDEILRLFGYKKLTRKLH